MFRRWFWWQAFCLPTRLGKQNVLTEDADWQALVQKSDRIWLEHKHNASKEAKYGSGRHQHLQTLSAAA